ncbi:7869_t:CDS:2 [Paraglomus occultum]|uniref:7869_t:CDS:1 n=1 Tax=Paraglomus occultum TaxID=144539 RepID=A0A9N8WM99_9GLOM|nr:7869_t:CDS:2 [Paraglomus occultum]
MSETEVNPVSIYNKIISLKVKPQNSAKSNGSVEPQSVNVLRVETASVSKELGRFRACDSVSCFYCREWALYIYKRCFSWMAKGQSGDTVKQIENGTGPKENAATMCQSLHQLCQKYADDTGTFVDPGDLADELIKRVFEWIKTPSAGPRHDVFAFVDFEIALQNMPCLDKESSPIKLLQAIILDKSHCQISKDSFHLLKNITKAQLTDQVQPVCHHTRPAWKIPNDLDVVRQVFNDQMRVEKSKHDQAVKEILSEVWGHTTVFLAEVQRLASVREATFGKGCMERLDSFMKEYHEEVIPFQDYWTPIAETYKKTARTKKGNKLNTSDSTMNAVDDVDAAFSVYLNNARTILMFWEEGFVNKSYADAANFVNEFVQQMTKYMEKTPARVEEENMATIGELVKKSQLVKTALENIGPRVNARIADMQAEVTKRNREILEEIDALEEAWESESQKTLQGRLEKANNKEFRKRTKKLENLLQSARQWTISSVGTLFSAVDFAHLFIGCLEVLLMEGEVWESVQIRKHCKKYEGIGKKLDVRRQQIMKDFKEGITTGRRVLAGVIGRLFLREASRLVEETMALKKQDEFLQSIDQTKAETGKKKKGGSNGSNATVSAVNDLPSGESKTNNSGTVNSVAPTASVESAPVVEKGSQAADDQVTKNKRNESQKTAQKSYEDTATSDPVITSTSETSNKRNSEEISSSSSRKSKPSVELPPLNGSQSKVEDMDESPRTPSKPPGLDNEWSNEKLDKASAEYLEYVSTFDGVGRSDLIVLVHNLQKENTNLVSTLIQMQQEVKGMTARYSELVEMAREREVQTVQLLQARKQQEMEEAARYIQMLEMKIAHLEKNRHGSSQPESPLTESAPHSPIPTIGGLPNSQAGSTSSFTMNYQFANTSQSFLNPWRGASTTPRTTSLRCGNCGEQGHVSADCSSGCRYCGGLNHLSENCGQSGIDVSIGLGVAMGMLPADDESSGDASGNKERIEEIDE